MQRVVVPKQMVDCIFSTLQNAFHQVRTGYGNSDVSYGGPCWLIPMHGIGQGNGAGPAIWAVVSTPLLNILHEQGYGVSLVTPIFGLTLNYSGFAFVDDTDLVQMALYNQSSSDVCNKLQAAVDLWEASLAAISGAIVPEKTFWYLVDFHWARGFWRYKTIPETVRDLSVQDISLQRKVINRVEVTKAKETLGIFLSPSGSKIGEFKKLQQIAEEWVASLQNCRLSRVEVWIALQSTLWHTLSYPLPVTTLSKAQWEEIMSIVLRFALPAMGICRSFPCDIVFAPLQYFGLGILHLHSLQEIARLKDIIQHSHLQTTTGKLYIGSLETLHLEIGLPNILSEVSYVTHSHLATHNLLKCTWEF
jgi:hypothetical protein